MLSGPGATVMTEAASRKPKNCSADSMSMSGEKSARVQRLLALPAPPALWLSRAAFAQPVLADLVVQRGLGARARASAVRARLPLAAQRVGDQGCARRLRPTRPAGAGGVSAGPAPRAGEPASMPSTQAVGHVAQLAHVAGPGGGPSAGCIWLGRRRPAAGGRGGRRPAAGSARSSSGMSSRRSRSGGSVDGDHVEPVVQVGAEAARARRAPCRSSLVAAITRHVHRQRLVRAQALDHALLQHPQQLDLHRPAACSRSRRGTACRRWRTRSCRCGASARR